MLLPYKDQIENSLDNGKNQIEIHCLLQKDISESELECEKMRDFIEKHFKSKNEIEHMLSWHKDQAENSLDNGMSEIEIDCLLQKEISELECAKFANFTNKQFRNKSNREYMLLKKKE